MHSNREGIPIIFQAGPSYLAVKLNGERWMEGFGLFQQGLTPPRYSPGCPTVVSVRIGATCSRAECG
jgi:hypothetical protein